MSEHPKWRCPKCTNAEFETGQFRAVGGTLSRLFDVQNRKFTTVSCTRCGFTEIYRASSSTLGKVFDLFTG